MNYKAYNSLYKTLNKSNTNLAMSLVLYTLIYTAILICVNLWTVNIIAFIYFSLYVLVLALTQFFDYYEGKGEKALLTIFRYTPVSSLKIYFFSYFKKMWFSTSAIFDIYIPFILFLIIGFSWNSIVTIFYRIHACFLVIIYLQYLFIYLKQKKSSRIFLVFIFIASVTSFNVSQNIKLEKYLGLYSSYLKLFDIYLLTLLLISISTFYFIINSLLSNKRKEYSIHWINITNLVAKTLALPVKFNLKIYNLTIYIVKAQLRNNQLMYSYLFSIAFIIFTRTVWNNVFIKSDFQIISTLALILSMTIFNRVKPYRFLENSLKLVYLPIGDIKKKLLEDLIGLINILIIWFILTLELSITHNFSLSNIFIGTILLISYYLISIGFSLPIRDKSDDKELERKKGRQTLKINFMYVLCQVLINLTVPSILNINYLFIFLILPLLLLWTYFRTYKRISSSKTMGVQLKEYTLR
ncbi:hypothetical protein [Priestia aryabhattai]|uniref:hypothetical protein n=1 Tax=Priestia aryabhattai TaxID=412384 RepID=UPI001CF9A893|nr:hypothetical protein [Priestia aryabhattai]